MNAEYGAGPLLQSASIYNSVCLCGPMPTMVRMPSTGSCVLLVFYHCDGEPELRQLTDLSGVWFQPMAGWFHCCGSEAEQNHSGKFVVEQGWSPHSGPD